MFYSLNPSAHLRTIELSPRDQRMLLESRRVKHNLTSIIRADSRVETFGPDPVVDKLLSAAGFSQSEAFSVRLCVKQQSKATGIIGIVVLSRVLDRHEERQALTELKRNASRTVGRCIIIPQRYLSGSLRLTSAKVISACRNLRLTTSDRMQVLMLLASEGYASLQDCAAQINGSDPFGAVLRLVADGVVAIDRSVPIGPHTRVTGVEI